MAKALLTGETYVLMLTVAKRLVIRCPTAAQGDFVALPRVAARAIQDAQIARQQQGTIFDWLNFQLSA